MRNHSHVTDHSHAELSFGPAGRYSACEPARTASPSPIQTVLMLQNSLMPCADSSRPYPEFFTPPNGSSLNEVVMPLMKTPPACRSLMNAACSASSLVQALEPRPKSVPLAISI